MRIDERMINELQMLTGKKCNDLTYMVYLLLKGGTYFSECEKSHLEVSAKENAIGVEAPSLDEWFSQFN